ncbi:MAG: CpsD/CapB family tyrosine-protein kinase, partial [Lachnoclostridium sp.]|nr:CpsD/CapB family tyrosine-protein kinase [Lachnoclostridium sp.]
MNTVKLEEYLVLDYNLEEAYKTLRTNLEFCGDDIKVIMMTSCTPNEGKSTLTVNLAKTLGEAGKKTILIDADLRKSVLVGRHRVGRVKGLSHYLSGQSTLEDIIYATNFDLFHIIFAGSLAPNPTELLGNKYFSKMVKKLREEYDYVIIDTPP